MKGIKFKAVLAGRKFALLGAAVAVAGLGVLGGAGVANAALGTQPGALTFNPGTIGTALPLTTVPTWSTTIACPATANASAKLLLVNPDGVTLTAYSANINGAAAALTNEPVLTGASVGSIESLAGFTAGSHSEFVVECFPQASGVGTPVPFMDDFVTFNTDGTTYTLSNTAPTGPVTPSVVLNVQPNPVQVGTNVTLTATVTAIVPPATTAAPVTTGAVQFESGGTAIGTPVTVNATTGVATSTTSFTAPSGATPLALTAVYQTANAAQFNNATSNTVNETVTATNPLQQTQQITVTVPPQGAFTFTGTANATDSLTVNSSTSPLTASGTTSPVTVTDSRTGLAPNPSIPSLVNGFNGFPGWSVVGQATDFTDPTSTPAGLIPVANLQWTPAAVTGDATAGAATTTGLGTAATLASALTGHGQGTFALSAALNLTIPTSAPAGAYTSTLTLTANPTANFH